MSPDRFAGGRRELIARLYGDRIPSLWCPLLTHYTHAGAIDKARIKAHLAFLAPSVRGFLIPGSTGDGWELSDGEVRELLEFAIDEMASRKLHLLIGVLKTTTADVLQTIRDTLAWLRQRTAAASDGECLVRSAVRGFTVCPPKGASLSQHAIRDSLAQVLELRAPVALYQLPQVTENEMSAETLAALAGAYPNFYMLKDTSGADRAAHAGFDDVFLVRGAEGDYVQHLRDNGGNYDGFLLSTANCFGHQLRRMIDDLHEGRVNDAERFSQTLTELASEVFAAAGKLSFGNPFTNANKALDHFFAHGPRAANAPAPRAHSGDVLPPDLIGLAGDALARHGLMPVKGYLDLTRP